MASTEKVIFEGATPGKYNVVMRSGEAEKIYPPRALNFDGLITEPTEFYRQRKSLTRLNEADGLMGNIPAPYFRPHTTNVVANRDAGTIKLTWDENSEFRNIISGTIQISRYYNTLGINQPCQQKSPNDLADMLQRHRFLFANKELGMEVISKLKNLKASIQTEIENAKDDRGSKKALLESKVTSNIPTDFLLSFPAFKGMKEEQFRISIVLENIGQAVTCWLESIDAIERMEAIKNQIFDDLLEPFFKDGITVIEE